MNDRELRSQIIRIAHDNPGAVRENLLTVLNLPDVMGEKDSYSEEECFARAAAYMQAEEAGVDAFLSLMLASSDKTAFSEDTAKFVSWVMDRAKAMDSGSFERDVEKLTGQAFTQPSDIPPAKRGPLGEGETVIADKHKCANENNMDLCEKYHAGREGNVYGIITKVSGNGLLVQFHNKGRKIDSPVAFDGKASGKKSGLYRHTLASKAQGGAESRGMKGTMVELIYTKGGTKPPPIRDQEKFAEYIKNGLAKGEDRTFNYYTGNIVKATYNKAGEPYFLMTPQQRSRPTAINPNKGKIWYLGRLGGRPGGWKKDLYENIAATIAG